MFGLQSFSSPNLNVNPNSKIPLEDFKKIFIKKGPCPHALFYALNLEFGHQKETEEFASDPFAGGLMQTGYQCGMLWGASLGVGAESFRRHENHGQAIAAAITATQHLMDSFSKRAKTVNCLDITKYDTTTKFGMVKFFLTGKPFTCMNLAGKWGPEAIQAAVEGLSHKLTDLPQKPKSCASEVAGKMGASDEEMIMVAGFAGGLGLSGNACGALSAAIFMNTLAWCRNHPGKSGSSNPGAKKILKAFYDETDSEILCHTISGKQFKTIGDHTEFVNKGGCDKLMNVLALT